MLNNMKTCFENCRLLKIDCKNTACRHSIDNCAYSNCSLLAVKKGQSQTLADVGDVFGLTRMRICQIEKSAIKKIRDVS